MDEKELQAIRARAEHTPPLRPARLKEIETLASYGVPLARDCMHMVRAWQASQAALREALRELREKGANDAAKTD
jgi:hypothetical protein